MSSIYAYQVYSTEFFETQSGSEDARSKRATIYGVHLRLSPMYVLVPVFWEAYFFHFIVAPNL